jgi:hypothetical protein
MFWEFHFKFFSTKNFFKIKKKMKKLDENLIDEEKENIDNEKREENRLKRKKILIEFIKNHWSKKFSPKIKKKIKKK